MSRSRRKRIKKAQAAKVKLQAWLDEHKDIKYDPSDAFGAQAAYPWKLF